MSFLIVFALLFQPPIQATVYGQGSPVVLIPGLISGGQVWDETVAVLKDRHECHQLTLPGFAGVAPFESGPYLPKFKNAIIEYIRTHDLRDVTLVGHSLGGFLSLLIAMDDIEEVSRIVVVDALPFLAGAMNPAAKAGIDTAMIRRYIDSFATLDLEQTRAARLAAAKGNVLDSTKWNNLVEWTMASDVVTEANAVGELMGTDLREAVGSIRIPVLVLAAHADMPQFPQFTAEYVGTLYRDQYKAIPDVRVEVTPKSRHFIMYDELDWMTAHIRRFVSETR